MKALKFVLSALLLTIVSRQAAALDLVALDNTASLTEPITTNLGSISATNNNAKVFQVGASSAVLKSFGLSLYNATAGNANVTVKLFNVDGTNNPTGSALATDTFTASLTPSAAYYTFNSTLGGYSLQAGTKYALVFSGSPTSGGTISWTKAGTASLGSAYVAAPGWSYITNLRSTNSGSTWAANSYYNGMMMTVTTTVPEPSTCALTMIAAGFACVAGRRRKAQSA